MIILRDDNFQLIASAIYSNSQCCTDEEFMDDIARFKYLKKLLSRYDETGELRERLILNHIVVLNNVFGPTQTVRFLYFKLENHFSAIKPFLEFLNILPKHIDNVRKEGRVFTNDIVSDETVQKKLEEI